MQLDVLIVGGGAAGLWLLDDLRRAGYSALLVEAHALGSGQTVASQGILHGGVKHALAGRQRAFVRALNRMPSLWRECLAGRRQPDLRQVRLRSAASAVWRTKAFGSFLGLLGVRLGLNSTLVRLDPADRPAPLAAHPGEVYRLEEQVIDPTSLLAVLAERHRSCLIAGQVEQIDCSEPGRVSGVRLISTAGDAVVIHPRHVILAAGTGNEALRSRCGFSTPVMRRLPLRILVLRGALPDLNGFCLDGTKAKAIVTTQRLDADQAVWQVACERLASMDPAEFERAAMRELRESLPGFAWPDVAVSSYSADRAEPLAAADARASDVFIQKDGNVVTAWPTKLVLVPRLAEKIRELLPSPSVIADPDPAFADWPRPTVARYPWESP